MPNRFQLAILQALQNRPMYAGTVASAEKARRRAKNKAAKRARKGNRS